MRLIILPIVFFLVATISVDAKSTALNTKTKSLTNETTSSTTSSKDKANSSQLRKQILKQLLLVRAPKNDTKTNSSADELKPSESRQSSVVVKAPEQNEGKWV